MSDDPQVFYDVQPTCTCGRFIAESSIVCEDFRDDSYYYGIRTETQFTCSRCGVIKDEPRYAQVREIPFICLT